MLSRKRRSPVSAMPVRTDWYEKAKSVFGNLKPLLGWSMPANLLISAIVSVLATNSFMGYFFTLATHSYAERYGFRVPGEGIDYIAVALLTFSPTMFFGAALTGGILYFFFSKSNFLNFKTIPIARGYEHQNTVASLASPFATANPKSSVTKKDGNLIILVCLSTLWLVLMLLFWRLHSVDLPNSCVMDLSNYLSPSQCPDRISLFIVAMRSTAIVAALAAAWRPSIAWWAALLMAVLTLGFGILLQFDESYYAKHLRQKGYGGGLPVSIVLVQADGSRTAPKVSGYLLMRTPKAVVVFDDSQNTIAEYSMDRVERIEHLAGGLLQLKYKLPPPSATKSSAW